LLNAGDELAIPVAIALAMPHPLHYVTRVGDTLVTVADRFNVSVEDLRRWNHLSSSRIEPRRSLYVSQPIHLAPVARTHSKSSRAKTGANAKQPAASAKPAAKLSSSNASAAKPSLRGAAAKKAPHPKQPGTTP
jgi:membrane-bound lytic murein transglycosylase D